MNLQSKFQTLNKFLNQSLRAAEYRRASLNLDLAREVLQQIEASTLSNPNVSETDIESVVKVSRNPVWRIAESRLQTLQ